MFGAVYRYITGNHELQNESSENKGIFDPQIIGPDLVRTSWCKGALEQVANSCCHLFDYIKMTQGNENWGNVLDAGSGSHSLEWILGLPTQSCTALIGDTVMKNSLEKNYSSELRPQDRILIGNWKDPQLFKGEVFDVVIADYLIGAMDAFAPYFQDKMFDRLKPHVGKRLYITGAEPFPDRATGNPHGELIIEVSKLRDACILLAGERPYREFPMDWILRFLKISGYKILGVGFYETVYSKSYVENQINVAESKLKKFKSFELEENMGKHIETVRSKVKSMKWGIRFGSDYVVAAVPIRENDTSSKVTHTHTHSHSHSHTNSNSNPNSNNSSHGYVEDEKIIVSEGVEYRSLIQEQNEVFPIDEEK